MTALVLTQVSLSVGARRLFPPLDLVVEPGEVVTVMGPSGVGKSSLLACLGGFLDPDFTMSGCARIGDIDLFALPPEKRRLGIQFQDDLLFPNLSVGENIAFGLEAGVLDRIERKNRIRDALTRACLANFEARDPASLSGGQRARVALMRTLVSRPRALLLDEPFNKLDLQLRDDMRAFVFAHARAERLPTLLVTHDPADAAAAGGRIVTLAAEHSALQAK